MLPPKPEHIRRVRIVLESAGQPVRLADLVARTKLTNTQALCALEAMIRNGNAKKESRSNTFLWLGPTTSDHLKTTNPEAHNASKSTINDLGQIPEN